MYYSPRGAALLLLVLGALPVSAADDKKPADPPAKTDKKADAKKDAAKTEEPKPDPAKKDAGKTDKKPAAKANPGPAAPARPAGTAMPMPANPPKTNTEKSVRSGVVTGRVTVVMEEKKSIRLEVSMHVPQLNQGAANQLAQAQLNMARATSAQALIQAQQQMLQAQAQLITYQEVKKEYELEATDDIKIRMANPPPQYDEKGRIKKYTRAELKELKGDDPRLPGYKAEFGDLRQDQIVQVSLVRKKDAPRRPVKKEDVDLLTENLPQMSMIVVLYEPKQ